MHDELQALPTFRAVDLRPGKVRVAEKINHQRDTTAGEGGVPLTQRIVEREAVLEPRAATAIHMGTQPQGGIAFFNNELLDARRGAVGQVY